MRAGSYADADEVGGTACTGDGDVMIQGIKVEKYIFVKFFSHSYQAVEGTRQGRSPKEAP